MAPTIDTWSRCYDSGWNGLIVPEAYSHPAKFSRPLIQRIYQHCAAEGWLAPGETVLDCFAGTGLGGLDAGLAGYRFIGVELEFRFHAIAHGFDCGGSAAKHEACPQQGDHDPHHVTGNLELWQRRYSHLPQWVAPTLLQGDSRRLGEVLREQVTACVSSPPYAALDMHDTGTKITSSPRPGDTRQYARTIHPPIYGDTPGQLGAMPPGSLDACLSSPPYADGCTQQGHDYHPERMVGTRTGYIQRDHANYDTSPAQLGNLPAGTVEAVVSSPPWETQLAGSARAHAPHDTTGRLTDQYKEPPVGSAYTDVSQRKRLPDGTWPRQREAAFYNNLGQTHADTFWSAAREIIAQCIALLKPNGIAVWVVKSYVREGHIVDFPGDWRRLCESLGLVTLHEHHALLVEAHGTQGGLFGEDTTHRTERKSFFRRLHEKKRPDLAIDFEVVLCMQKRGNTTTGNLDACVSSPPFHDPRAVTGRDASSADEARQGRSVQRFNEYGATEGQLGAMPPGPTPAKE
jgi:hypothetical protein